MGQLHRQMPRAALLATPTKNHPRDADPTHTLQISQFSVKLPTPGAHWTTLIASAQQACMGMRQWTPGRQTAELRFQPGHLILAPSIFVGNSLPPEFHTHRPTVTHRQAAALTPPPSHRFCFWPRWRPAHPGACPDSDPGAHVKMPPPPDAPSGPGISSIDFHFFSKLFPVLFLVSADVLASSLGLIKQTDRSSPPQRLALYFSVV